MEKNLVLAKLDSVQQSASPGRYFAGLYINAVNNADNFWNTKTEEQKKLNLRFESRFASLFFAASDSFSLNKQPPPVWEYFFSGEEHSALQYQLLGINAHINGDIYQALTQEFSLQELKAYKANFLAFGKLLAEQYRIFFEDSYKKNRKIMWLHHFTFGLDKWYGANMLGKWRKRQFRLAELYYSKPSLYQREKVKLNLKMNRLNRLILTLF